MQECNTNWFSNNECEATSDECFEDSDCMLQPGECDTNWFSNNVCEIKHTDQDDTGSFWGALICILLMTVTCCAMLPLCAAYVDIQEQQEALANNGFLGMVRAWAQADDVETAVHRLEHEILCSMANFVLLALILLFEWWTLLSVYCALFCVSICAGGVMVAAEAMKENENRR
jgi:hypothetical protein